MAENEKRPELWYPTETVRREELAAWYEGPSGPASYMPAPEADETEKRRKKQRRTRIIALALSGLVLTASVVSVISSAVSLRRAGARGAVSAARQTEEPAEDYRDYFASYYTTSNEVTIETVKAGEDVELTLVSRAGAEPLSLQEIYRRINPAVVAVKAFREGQELSWGTGVIFRPDGYIITNTHIIQGADAASVTLPDGRSFDAKLIGEDEQSDIAVLKISGKLLPWAEFGDSAELEVGDEVAAIGNPLGELYAGTLTNGVVSAISRTVTNQGHKMTLLQTNAALNEGNSGGPLVNMYGQVVGITNMKIMSSMMNAVEGIGFAIPSSTVREVAGQLLRSGIVSGEPTIGITAGPVGDEARALYGLPAGVYVTEVREGSDAKTAGLQAGDIILRVNGIPVYDVAGVNAVKGEHQVGDTLTFTIYRDGESFEMDIKLVDKTDIRK